MRQLYKNAVKQSTYSSFLSPKRKYSKSSLNQNSIALVTGGNRGIGRAVSDRLAQEGINVIVFSRSEERATHAAASLPCVHAHQRHVGISCDVNNQHHVEHAVATARRHFPSTTPIRMLVNCAGISLDRLLLRFQEDDFDRVFDTNVRGTMNMTKCVAREMLKISPKMMGMKDNNNENHLNNNNKSNNNENNTIDSHSLFIMPSIVNVSSVVGIRGNRGQSVYAASKAAIDGFTKSVAQELGTKNIRVNSVAPGFIDTDMTENITNEKKQKIIENITLGRFGKPKEVANLIYFLLSDEASYITGQTFIVDGEQKQKLDPSSLFQLDDEDEYNSEDENAELELKGIEQLTSKLAKEIGEDIFKSDDEESSGEYDEEDEEDFDINNQEDREFRETLLKEFQQLTGGSGGGGEQVSKNRIKELYLELLQNGGSILHDRSMADTFLGKLSGPEMSSLMELMQKDPQDALEYFDGDADVMEAIKNTPATSALGSGTGSKPNLWDEIEKDFDESSDSDQDIQEIKDRASAAVQQSLATFEENILHFTQHPDELLRLSERLPTEKDKHDFLNILFSEYTPDRMRQKLGIRDGDDGGDDDDDDDDDEGLITKRKKKNNTKKQKVETPEDLKELGMDPDLVSLVFKEVLTHFRAYKKAPHKFDPLIQRLNDVEKQAFESLVKTFWDLSAENLRM